MVHVGCQREEADEIRATTEAAQRAAAPDDTTEEVAENPKRFVGQRLTLTGEVDEVFGDRAFELEGNDVIFDDELLVLSKSPIRLVGQPVKDDDRVIVTGTVREFTVTELERDLTWDLDPELEVRWRDGTAFVAESVSLVGESARWSEKDATNGLLVGLVSIYRAPDPSALAGQPISLEAVSVQGKAGQALWVGENEQNKVLVVPKEGQQLPEISKGERVQIEGTVREMPEPNQAVTKFRLDPGLRQQVADQALFVEAASVKKSGAPS